MNKHNWINGKCTRCKCSWFVSNGLDSEEPHKDFGMTDGASQVFYMLNDGNFTVTDIEPKCSENEQVELLPNFTIEKFSDGSEVLKIH